MGRKAVSQTYHHRFLSQVNNHDKCACSQVYTKLLVAFAAPQETGVAFQRTDSQETPTTPLFDDDTSQPLEEFPRVTYVGEGWDMHLRQPNKKKITGQR